MKFLQYHKMKCIEPKKVITGSNKLLLVIEWILYIIQKLLLHQQFGHYFSTAIDDKFLFTAFWKVIKLDDTAPVPSPDSEISYSTCYVIANVDIFISDVLTWKKLPWGGGLGNLYEKSKM